MHGELDSTFANPAAISPNNQENLYTGRQLDFETGLLYYRYYNLTLGRFIGRDPLEYLGSQSNLFEYVTSSPVNKLDPTGALSISGCSRPPRPAEQCCKDVAKEAAAKNYLGSVVCCDGRKISCVFGDPVPKSPQANALVKFCVKRHEDFHHAMTLDCEQAIGVYLNPTPFTEETDEEFRKEECDAHLIELDCYMNAIKLCKDEWCTAGIYNQTIILMKELNTRYRCGDFYEAPYYWENGQEYDWGAFKPNVD